MSPLLESGEATAVLHYTWYANETDKVLTCSASGSPSPDFSWEKDNGVSCNIYSLPVTTHRRKRYARTNKTGRGKMLYKCYNGTEPFR